MKCILCISKNTTFYREFREYKHFRMKYSILIQLSVLIHWVDRRRCRRLYSFQFQVSFFLFHQITQFPLNIGCTGRSHNWMRSYGDNNYHKFRIHSHMSSEHAFWHTYKMLDAHMAKIYNKFWRWDRRKKKLRFIILCWLADEIFFFYILKTDNTFGMECIEDICLYQNIYICTHKTISNYTIVINCLIHLFDKTAPTVFCINILCELAISCTNKMPAIKKSSA